jgi:LysM repeat protein
MFFKRIKNIIQSKYFKPGLKIFILLWFLFAVYDLFFKSTSDSSEINNRLITNNINVSTNDSVPVNTSGVNNNKPDNKINSNEKNNNSLYNYTVSKNDKLSDIAKRFKTTKDKLKQLNSLKSEQLKAGTILKVPVKLVHVVKKGETLYSIAVKYGTTRKILIEANKLPNESAIKAGQSICIPLL